MKSDKRPPWSVNDLWDRYEAERAAHIRQLEIIKKVDDALSRLPAHCSLFPSREGWFVMEEMATANDGPVAASPIAALLAWYDNLPEEAP